MAQWARQSLFDGDLLRPAQDLFSIVEDVMGIPVIVGTSKTIEGASAMIDGRPVVFVAKRFVPRMLFTLAHELAHLFVHHDHSSVAFIDEELDESDFSPSAKLPEQFADAFAGALLLPSQGVALLIKKFREMSSISPEKPIGDVEINLTARFFGVSFEVAARRCESLALLPSGAARAFVDWMKANHGSAEKRAEGLQLPPRAKVDVPEVSSVLLRSAIDQIERGELSIGQATAALSTSIDAVYAAHR
ncbi:MAG: ImmA/IrrE family metallo-endopeptidase [Clostridia bacterium]|nr:ImmA/IrrE family metallo-endopeptidase [Deltaproteobacteria bacterium]